MYSMPCKQCILGSYQEIAAEGMIRYNNKTWNPCATYKYCMYLQVSVFYKTDLQFFAYLLNILDIETIILMLKGQ